MEGNFRMCTNPQSKEVKVKPCLGGRILLKHLIMHFLTKAGGVDKMASYLHFN